MVCCSAYHRQTAKCFDLYLAAQVDADAHRSLGEKFGVRGFPTIKWFPRGKPSDPVE